MKKTLIQRLIVGFSLGVVIGLILVNIIPAYDSTDNYILEKRSGLGLYIDHLTGCHYLGTKFGGITERKDAEGNHICRGYEYEPKD